MRKMRDKTITTMKHLATFEQNRIWALNRLKEIFHDEDNNLERWLKGECCIFRMNHSEQPMSVNIGKDIEGVIQLPVFLL